MKNLFVQTSSTLTEDEVFEKLDELTDEMAFYSDEEVYYDVLLIELRFLFVIIKVTI